MKNYLAECEIIDFSNEAIQILSKQLAKNCISDEDIARNCFIYVRDNIRHSGDFRDEITTCKASDVLKYQTGRCYAKSHLLTALLRANRIPAGFCYQRLNCGEYQENIYCLHGLNAIYLKNYGCYRVDARGNKQGVDAQFNPPFEQLAFNLQNDEFNLEGIFDRPLDIVIEKLLKNKNYHDMINDFPDIK